MGSRGDTRKNILVGRSDLLSNKFRDSEWDGTEERQGMNTGDWDWKLKR